MKLSYNNQLILVGVMLLVLAGVVVGLLIVPQIRAIAEVDERLAEADVQISQAQALLAQRQSIKARAAETEAKRMRLANQMPEAPELPSLIVELQDNVNAAGLEFASITPAQPSLLEEGYSEILITMLVRGTWADTVDLLQRLPRLTRQVRISTFNVSEYEPPAAEGETPSTENLVQTSMTIRVYTMPSTIEAPAAPPAPDDAAQTQ